MTSSLSFRIEYRIPLPVSHVYLAWTSGWGLWLADAASVRLSPQVGAPFFFEIAEPATGLLAAASHPHYGRFLKLVPHRVMCCTWVTGVGGTDGVETTLDVQLRTEDTGHTHCTVTHQGFGSDAARDRHAAWWPVVLASQATRLFAVTEETWQLLVRTSGGSPLQNRSMPDSTLIPTRSYPDLDAAVRWLRDVLGCHERLRVPGERVQLTVGNAAVVVAAWDPATAPASGGRPPATLLIRVANVDDAYARALASGASGLSEPASLPFGERQATVRDPAGHSWTLSHTIADVDPATWGGILANSAHTHS